MWRDRDVVGVSQRCDAVPLSDTRAGDVVHEDVVGASLELLPHLVSRARPLPYRNRHVQRAGYLGLARDVVGHRRRFQPSAAQRLHVPTQQDRVGDGLAHVNIHHQHDLGAYTFAHGAANLRHTFNIKQQVQLQRAISQLDMLRRRVCNLAGVSPANAGIQRHFIAIPATGQLVHRHTYRLADDVPERDICARYRIDVEASRMPTLAHRAVVAGPNRLDVKRVAPHDQRAH